MSGARLRTQGAPLLALALLVAAGAASEPERAFPFGFAPPGAKHDEAARYALPYDPRIPRVMNQGPGNPHTHTGPHNANAFDFLMPIGTPLRAAREGKVAHVYDGFGPGGDDRAKPGNQVTVLHDDGTFAMYTHLAAGIPVRVGQRVARGAPLGKSGNSGYCPWPHLHFAVARVDPAGADYATVPIRFGAPGGPGFVPKEGDFVGFPPKPTLELAVFVGGKPTRPDEVVSVRRGERLAVRVEARPAGGSSRDLTGHPALQLVPMTPWSVAVPGPAELVIGPMPGFTIDGRLGAAQRDAAVLGVFYLPGGAGEIGLGQVQLLIAGDAPAP